MTESLFAEVVATLTRGGLPHALIGAGALGVYAAPRASLDLDLLVQDRAVLSEAQWAAMAQRGVPVRIRRGDYDDPLAGVIRIGAQPEYDDEGTLVGLPADVPVDVVVIRGAWADRLLERAIMEGPLATIAGASVRCPAPADLILLKLYAGGGRDKWDIEELLALPDGPLTVVEVDTRVADLPADARDLWANLRPKDRARS